MKDNLNFEIYSFYSILDHCSMRVLLSDIKITDGLDKYSVVFMEHIKNVHQIHTPLRCQPYTFVAPWIVSAPGY